MTTNDRRLDKIEEAQANGGPPMPSSWEVCEEIRRMEGNPAYKSKWSHETVQCWISELEAQE